MGLFAAIPAVMFYNRFVSKVEALENRYINFMDEFATILNRRLVRVRSEMNMKNNEVPQNSVQPSNGYSQKSFNHPLGEEHQNQYSRARANTHSSPYQTPGVEGDRYRNSSRSPLQGQ